MAEREIEAAYRARFRDQASREDALQQQVERAATRVLGNQVAFAMVARPINSRQPYLGQITPAEIQQIQHTMLRQNRMLVEPSAVTMHYLDRPKRGLRKWIVEQPADDGLYALLEVHDDGAVLLALRNYGAEGLEERSDVNEYHVHHAPARLAHLVEAAAEVLRLHGDFDARFLMKSRDSVIWIRKVEHNRFAPYSELVGITGADPIEAVLSISDDPDVMIEQVRGMALDALNSGGIGQLKPNVLRHPQTPEPAS